MANKYDLSTWYYSCSSATSASTNIGGNIAAGKTRFLTYLRIERCEAVSHGTNTSGASILIASHANSTISYGEASAAKKFALKLYEVEMSATTSMSRYVIPEDACVNAFPDTPDINHPICAVAGGTSAYMMMCRSNAGPPIRIFAQYYDE